MFIDGDQSNNNISNLMLCKSIAEHEALHVKMREDSGYLYKWKGNKHYARDLRRKNKEYYNAKTREQWRKYRKTCPSCNKVFSSKSREVCRKCRI